MIEENIFYKRFYKKIVNDRRLEQACEEDEKWDELRWAELSDTFDNLKRRGVNTEEIWQELRTVSAIYGFCTSWVGCYQAVLKDRFSYLQDFKKIKIPKKNFNTSFVPNWIRTLLRQKHLADAYEEFMGCLEERKEKTGVKEYRGKGLTSLPIFTELIGFLGNTLRCYIHSEKQKKREVILSKECAKFIADILNGFFLQFEPDVFNFNWRLIHRRYNDLRTYASTILTVGDFNC